LAVWAAFAAASLVAHSESSAMEHVPDGIHGNGVGRIALGAALPKDLVPKDASKRYVGGYHADGQAHDGFRLDAPPVTVFLDRGPFQQAAQSAPVDASKAKSLAAKAVKVLRAGAKVTLVLAESAKVKTAAGQGVGSDLKALKAAYPDLQVARVPATFGGDECVATSKKIPNVYLHFKTCAAAEKGDGVVRVLVVGG
jgi:hypothetical protein